MSTPHKLQQGRPDSAGGGALTCPTLPLAAVYQRQDTASRQGSGGFFLMIVPPNLVRGFAKRLRTIFPFVTGHAASPCSVASSARLAGSSSSGPASRLHFNTAKHVTYHRSDASKFTHVTPLLDSGSSDRNPSERRITRAKIPFAFGANADE